MSWTPCDLVTRTGSRASPTCTGTRTHGIARFLTDRLAHVGLHGQLLHAIAHGHEGAPKRVAIDLAADVDQPSGPEELDRFGPHHVGPAALRRALLERGFDLLLSCSNGRICAAGGDDPMISMRRRDSNPKSPDPVAHFPGSVASSYHRARGALISCAGGDGTR